ncbi:probable cyclic nucleotide-gated ion channel 20, chloroplastic isoform X2 [Cucumis melo]|uniref:Probable cyclic nucleotide-gated ion channel 20, chloroplastic isoform X2 n=1 Tax=Cucumis melo TaxID=3656 RepID=A0ABM3KF53_CUCME|nr:probable cyclic nucleotide-gated ion channel 20, chloroplastic isoform X2 [Cucumis melo]
MAAFEKDDIPMLSNTDPPIFDEQMDSYFPSYASLGRSSSLSIPANSSGMYSSEANLVGHTGPLRIERSSFAVSGSKNTDSKPKKLSQSKPGVTESKTAEPLAEKFPSFKIVDDPDWSIHNYAGRNEHLIKSGQLGLCNDPFCITCPTYNSKVSQQKSSRISGIFDAKFRLAYVAPESRVVGAGELVDHPKKIAMNYLKGNFFIDLLVVLPLPQIIIFLVLPKSLGSSGANYAKNLLRTAVTVQYIPRLYRFLPLLAGQSPSGFVFETAWANFVINLLTFMLAGHIVGSFWYLLGLQRVTRCFRDACNKTGNRSCLEYIDCGHGDESRSQFLDPHRDSWKHNENATACFSNEGFGYGIYLQAVNLTTEKSILTRYTYSLFWGFQQISTLAGNQVPSYYVYEVLFTMGIIGLGLLLFALLIGNMQNFLQALGRRRLEMSLRRRDVEQWMEHRRLPENLRRQVRQAERYNWASTRGVNEERIFENLPEDLQKNIRRHLFKFVNKVRIFALMDYEPILDAIRERLRQKTYIEGSEVFSAGDTIEKMVFIVRGKMESRVDGNGIVVPLSEGDVCGEELLTWCLEHSSINKDMKRQQVPAPRLVSNRTVRCLSNVEAFSLRAADLEEVTSMFSRFLRNPRVQGAIRYESPYWRYLAAMRIQVAWRYRKRRLSRVQTSQSN